LKPADEKTKKESKFPWKKGTKKQNPSEESTKVFYLSNNSIKNRIKLKISIHMILVILKFQDMFQ